MKLPYSWLKDLLPDLPPVPELEPVLAALGLPLEGAEESPAAPDGVLLVTLLAAEPIEGTKLTRLRFDAGPEHGEREVASGAPNAVGLVPGTMLALVTPGTALGGVTYGVRELQGVTSWGMAASEKELGIGEQSAGIMLVRAGEAPAGTPLSERWPADTVLDIEVTPNRADVLSVLGLCRDLAAYLQIPLREPPAGPPAVGEGEVSVALPPRGVVLERDAGGTLRRGCDHFVARTVSGLQNGPSPLWMQRHLLLSGLRPRSAAVDVGNWVMLELGQPVAVYDRRAVVGDHLSVAFGLKQGEAVTDLLGNTHALGAEDLLILDGRERAVPGVAQAFAQTRQAQTRQAQSGELLPGEGVLGIAGIVGGEHGHVTAQTRDVVVEAAHFDPVLLRRTAARLGLKTDAVYRFERGVDPLLPPRAADRVAGLLAELGAAPHPGATVVGEPAVPGAVTASGERIRALLGMDIPTNTMRDILGRLGCGVAGEGDELRVTPPSWRVDLNIWQDLAEEVARLHGYEHLPERLPTVHPHPGNAGASRPSLARDALRRTLAGLGFQEAVTYSFSSDEEASRARAAPPALRLQQPPSPERTGLRTALYPSLLRAASGYGRGERTLLFEIGRVFPPGGERERLGLLMRGDFAPAGHAPGVRGGFAAFRGLLGAFAAAQGAALDVEQLRGDAVPGALHPGVAGTVRWNGAPVGWLGALHPEVAQEFGLKGETFLAELEWPLPGRAFAFRDPSRAPAAWRDLAVIAPQAVSYGELARVLRAAGGGLLESVEPFDVYTGEQVGGGHRSVAVRLTYRGERTLTDADVDPVFAAQMDAVRAQGWSIRER